MCLALGLITGASLGAFADVSSAAWRGALVAAVIAAVAAYARRWSRVELVAATCVFACGGVLLAATARDAAIATPLRAALDDRFGGFGLGAPGSEGEHPPVLTRGVLTEDASANAPGAQVRVRVVAVWLGAAWVEAPGNILVSVAGTVSPERLTTWRAGRTVVAPATFRRPTRYLNQGVPDFELGLALRGTTLFGAVKSGLLVEVVALGTWRQERAAEARAIVRRTVGRWVNPHSSLSGAIVSAILIGDRTGLPDDVRERLQSAGVYHVLAISGGNIAILVGLLFFATRCLGMGPRASTLVTAVFLLVYAQVVVAGPSVFRAVVMALLYLVSRFLDLRTPAWQAVAVAAATSVGLEPLDVADAGFVLTFAATGALLAVVPLVTALRTRHPVARWVAGAVLASLATEAVLLPVSATAFGRVTFVGVLLNMAAIPLMTIVQVAGFALGLGAVSPAAGELAGWIAHLGAFGLVESARIADWVPMLTPHVPAPPPVLLVTYYLAGAAALFLRGASRYVGVATAVAMALLIVTGAWLRPRADVGSDLALTMFDVGQGEAMRVSWPGGGSTVIDSGGVPFGSGGFDVGDRVLRPALWAQGVRRIDDVLLTHGDPDHLGGASALFESFAPGVLLEGIKVPGHRPSQELRESVKRGGALVRELHAGDAWGRGGARVRVLSPDPPDWERRRVRNDDSVVLEVRYGDVAILLTGDIGADVERAILPRLSDAPVRVLKIGHHGSRTSTSDALIDAWRPHVALISCGRGNRFGHPAPDVIARLDRAGVETYRTDVRGAITLTTDGRNVRVTTFVP